MHIESCRNVQFLDLISFCFQVKVGCNKEADKVKDIRDLHNSMERQRRIEMKDAYDVLKATIPSIKDNDKVSKLNILNTAREYYLDLEALVRRTIAAKQRELDRRKYLIEKINLLKLQII